MRCCPAGTVSFHGEKEPFQAWLAVFLVLLLTLVWQILPETALQDNSGMSSGCIKPLDSTGHLRRT